ncbi:GIY-YIG nuclease family protein [Rubrivivax sp. JA1024]|nr:GIY-YIG nuclease family protein [Rubrivivax sp. JA1024]
MAERRNNYRYDLDVFGVERNDPGWIYIFENGDLLKVGKTTAPKRRIREARTWIPTIKIVGIKPFWNVSSIERTIHEGCAPYWHGGEWFEFETRNDYQLLIDGFQEFYEEDPDSNSVDFIYWWNSSGFAEFSIERRAQRMSLRRWKQCRAYP